MWTKSMPRKKRTKTHKNPNPKDRNIPREGDWRRTIEYVKSTDQEGGNHPKKTDKRTGNAAEKRCPEKILNPPRGRKGKRQKNLKKENK